MTDRDDPAGSASPAWDDPEAGEPVRDLSARRQALYVAMLVPLVAVVMFASFTSGGWGLALVGIVALGALVALIAWVVRRSGVVARRVGADRGRRGPHADATRLAREASPRHDPAAKLGRLLERLDRLPTDAVRLLAVRPLDPGEHEAARARASEAARFGARVVLIEDATTRIDDWIGRSFGTRSFDPELVALAWRHEPLRLEDRSRLEATLADAALAVAVEDLVDEATYGELVGPCTMLVDDGDPT